MISLERVSKSFDRGASFAVLQVTLEVPAHSFLAVVGESGSGKTTLLKLINPYDTRGIARAIQRAITMPLAERRSRHAASLATLRENDIHRWHTRFIEELQAVRGRTSSRRSAEPTDISAFRH